MERPTLRIFGIVALSLIFVGIAFGDDLMKLDKDGVVYYKVTPTGATSISATDNAAPALSVTQSGTSPAASFTGGSVGIGTANPLELFHVSGGHFLMDNQKAIKYKDSVGTAYPAFQFSDDEMYVDNQAAGGISFRTNPTKGSASTRLFIKNDGSIGIGTTTPSAKLHISDALANQPGLVIRTGDNAYDARFRWDSSGVAELGTYSNYPMRLVINGAERLRVNTSGNIGIGTTSPTCKLDISESSGSYGLRVDNASDSARGLGVKVAGSGGSGTSMVTTTSSGYALTLGIDNVEKMRLNTDGNVGIGTTTPDSNLKVIGSSSTSGIFTVAANSGSSTDKIFRVLKDTNPVLECVTVLRSGNVGIGTTTPPNKLSIYEATAGTNAVQIYNSSNNALKIRIPANGVSENFSGAESVLYVGKDVSTNRSINAAGSINNLGGDFAEWIGWEGEKPEPGTIINYKGTNVIVSSQKTAGFTGGDIYPEGTAILIAFVGQVPVRVKGEVREGDYILPGEDGIGIVVKSKGINFEQYRQAVGIAWEQSDVKEVKLIKVAVGIK